MDNKAIIVVVGLGGLALLAMAGGSAQAAPSRPTRPTRPTRPRGGADPEPTVPTGFGPPFSSSSYLTNQTTPTGPRELRIGADFYNPRCKGTCKHGALDFRAAQGTPIVSLGDGTITGITGTKSLCGQGVQLKMKGLDGGTYTALYCHMSRVDVRVGQAVSRGQTIGLSGGTPGTYGAGNSFGPHLHLELRVFKKDGKYHLVDPLPLIDWRPFELNVNFTANISRPIIVDGRR
jgi:murein DD-endopeptidase MepM/ murein hydrolase activator NlpD